MHTLVFLLRVSTQQGHFLRKNRPESGSATHSEKHWRQSNSFLFGAWSLSLSQKWTQRKKKFHWRTEIFRSHLFDYFSKLHHWEKFCFQVFLEGMRYLYIDVRFCVVRFWSSVAFDSVYPTANDYQTIGASILNHAPREADFEFRICVVSSEIADFDALQQLFRAKFDKVISALPFGGEGARCLCLWWFLDAPAPYTSH